MDSLLKVTVVMTDVPENELLQLELQCGKLQVGSLFLLQSLKGCGKCLCVFRLGSQ